MWNQLEEVEMTSPVDSAPDNGHPLPRDVQHRAEPRRRQIIIRGWYSTMNCMRENSLHLLWSGSACTLIGAETEIFYQMTLLWLCQTDEGP